VRVLKEKYSKKVSMPLVAALVVLCAVVFAAPGRGVVLDGKVDNNEWWGFEKKLVHRDVLAGYCAVTEAYVCHEVNAKIGTVTFGFFAKPSGCAKNSPVGAVFWVEGKVFARWQPGNAGSIDTANYSIEGAAWIPEPGEAADYYTYEIAISSKSSDHAAFFQLFRTLELQLYDSAGEVSKAFSYPVIFQAPESTTTTATTARETTKKETTTKVTTTKETTTKTTTTKATTTAKTTTTKATTAKVTTTKVTTTKEPATTKAVTTNPPVTTAKAAAAAKTAEPFMWTGMKTTAIKAAAAPPPAPAATINITQPAAAAPQKTEIIWYTVPITAESQAILSPQPNVTQDINDALLAYQMEAAQASPGAAAAPAFLDDAGGSVDQPPASMRTPLLFGAAGFLLALAALLFFMWLKGQRPQRAGAAVLAEDDENDDESDD